MFQLALNTHVLSTAVDWVDASLGHNINFIAAAGSKKVQAADDASGTNPVDIPFRVMSHNDAYTRTEMQKSTAAATGGGDTDIWAVNYDDVAKAGKTHVTLFGVGAGEQTFTIISGMRYPQDGQT